MALYEEPRVNTRLTEREIGEPELVLAGMQGWASNAYTIASDQFPKESVACQVGSETACGSGMAISLASAFGNVLQRTGSYRGLLIVAGLSLPLAITLQHLPAPAWEPIQISGGDVEA